MVGYRYAFQSYDREKMARAVGISLPISHKQAREICAFVKNRSVEKAKTILNDVMEMKIAVPYKRFNANIPHRAGMAAGRYPNNASKEILKLIKAVEAGANNKGLTGSLYITHICAHKAPAHPRSGRTPGEAKRAHVEVVVEANAEKSSAESIDKKTKKRTENKEIRKRTGKETK